MTREEQRIEQIDKFASQCYEDGERYSAFISGAIWADNNPAQDVVNLNDLWHDASEEPQDYPILCKDEQNYVWTEYSLNEYVDGWAEFVDFNEISQWAYIGDLFPKGGEQ